MRLPRPRRRIIVLAFGLLVAGAWYFRPLVVDTTILRADRITVFEGLPHPLYEELAFHSEQTSKPIVDLSGFPFYRQPLALKDEDVKTLRSLVGTSSTYRYYSGEKKCGGFHPDYAVEWSSGGKVYRCLICFGCGEARIDGPRRTSMYDLRLRGDRGSKLLDLLKPYRQNRPPHERFGPLVDLGAIHDPQWHSGATVRHG